MANEGRFLNKVLAKLNGIFGDNDSAIIQEGAGWTLIGGARIGGSGVYMTRVLSVLVQSQDFAAIEPAGSTGAQSIDMALVGVVPGDLCLAAPTQSLPAGVVWSAACYSAGVVNVRALHTQSGNIDLASTHWRVGAIQF